MTQQAGRTLTLHDLAADHQWIRMLGWSDDQLRDVLVHEEATAGDEMINLSNFGGTALGTSQNAGGGTSADARAIRNLFVYKSETPADSWRRLKDIVDQGGPSGYNKLAQSGDSGDVKFPPA